MKLVSVLSATSLLLRYCSIRASAGLLRSGTKTSQVKSDSELRRELAWIFVSTGDIVDNNESYDFYDSMPKDAEFSDRPDKLRTTDLCYKDGTFSYSNCPAPPDCNWSGKFGPAKLCINRAPRPDWVFYVAIMKCIPAWENCDKCLCGQMSSERDDSSCVAQDDCSPNDDTLSFSCDDRKKIKFQGRRWDVPDGTTDVTGNSIATSMPTATPTTQIPTPLPTAKPSTEVPTPLTTTKLPTQADVMNKTLLDTATPTNLPLKEKDFIFTQSQSTIQLLNVTITEGVFGGDIIVQRNYDGSF